MISFDNVSKQFVGREVVSSVNFTIGEGEVVGLLGPNGAGKTTSLRMMTGVLPATSGKVRIDGEDPIDSLTVKEKIGFLPENNPLYEDMTVQEWLVFWSRIKSEQTITEDQIRSAVMKSGLRDVYYRFIGELSKGYRQRVGLAQAILGQPRLLVLDEPTEGLDPNQRHDIHDLIKELGAKRTVIISSHVLSEITKMCSRVIILHKGKLVADGTPASLTQGSGQTVSAQMSGTGILTALKKMKGVIHVDESGEKGKIREYTIAYEGKADPRLAVFELAKDHDWKLYELTTKSLALEDVFTQLTT